jgi:hypothetical protein
MLRKLRRGYSCETVKSTRTGNTRPRMDPLYLAGANRRCQRQVCLKPPVNLHRSVACAEDPLALGPIGQTCNAPRCQRPYGLDDIEVQWNQAEAGTARVQMRSQFVKLG